MIGNYGISGYDGWLGEVSMILLFFVFFFNLEYVECYFFLFFCEL